MGEIEILAPGGSLESFKAAINAGANAIYMGGKMFSARAYASNFDNEDIKNLIHYAHLRNVKVYITVNTIIFEEEFAKVIEFVDFLYKNHVDAILIQDLGLASYLHEVYPDLVLHASTQLNCHNLAEAKALIELGFKRLVLARETPLEVTKKIKELGVEVEVFVHGALCVSYSGNCLMSSMIGGRSGNRGRCAQPCRNQMYCKSDTKISNPFAISMRDLCTIDHIGELIDMGIDSLKIEGRMKREEYVYEVVSSYRQSVDAYLKKVDFDANKAINDMGKLFNREFTKGYMLNESRTRTLNQRTSSHIGSHLGVVTNINKDYVFIKLDDDLSLQDGIRINNKNQDGQQVQKMFVNNVDVKEATKGQTVKLLAHNIYPLVGDEVIKTTSAKQIAQIDALLKNEKKIDIEVILHAHYRNALEIELKYKDFVVSSTSIYEVEKAKSGEIDIEKLKAQINRFGDSEFAIGKLELDIDKDAFIPSGMLNDIRRDATNKLQNLIDKSNKPLDKVNILGYYKATSSTNLPFGLSCQVENEDQLLKAICYPYQKILVNNKALFDKYQDGERIFLVDNRIDVKDESETSSNEVISYIKNNQSDSKNTLVSPYMNAVNSYMLDYLYSKGYSEVILSYELSKNRILNMIEEYRSRNGSFPNLAIPVYGYIDLMIMKSCPIATMNQMPKDHCNLCKKFHYVLEDRMNVEFEMMHDDNCNTRILNSSPLYLLDMLDEIEAMNISEGIVYFTNESEEMVDKISKEAFARLQGESEGLHFEKITRGHFVKEIE